MNIQKIKEAFHNFVVWLVVSSTDPSKTSLTVKGALLGVIPTILLVGQMLHYSWTFASLSQLTEGITALLTSMLIVVGLARKIYYLIFPPQNVQASSSLKSLK